jgi:hypothetical protein
MKIEPFFFVFDILFFGRIFSGFAATMQLEFSAAFIQKLENLSVFGKFFKNPACINY